MVDPSVQGTLNVLESIEKSPSIQRIVQTSSVAAVVSADKPQGHVFTEDDLDHSHVGLPALRRAPCFGCLDRKAIES